MKLLNVVVVAIIALAFIGVVSAADVTGDWTMKGSWLYSAHVTINSDHTGHATAYCGLFKIYDDTFQWIQNGENVYVADISGRWVEADYNPAADTITSPLKKELYLVRD
jgi:hypothetical protein